MMHCGVIEGEQRRSGGLGEAVRGDIAAIVMAIVGHVDFLLRRLETGTIFLFSPESAPHFMKKPRFVSRNTESPANRLIPCKINRILCNLI